MEKTDQLWPGGYRFWFDDTLFQPGTDSFLLGAFAAAKRGERVGDLALPRWLLAAVAREIQELRVPHHNDPDSDASEWMDQQPRLSRLYFLLSNFRDHLEVPEPNRLFGELNKLQALLEQYPLVDEEVRPALLTALRKQGQRLRKLNAWRELNS